MKKLSIIVPSYNSEEFLSKCIDSLLVDKDAIEVIIVNDGSKDRTQEIAEYYQSKYPATVKAVYQENAGHGGAINKGLQHVTGLYLKVVDSDDWLNAEALLALLDQIDTFIKTEPVDLIISNYVYEKEGKRHKKTMKYTKDIPIGKVISWNEFKLPIGKYLLMHSIVYRTEIIKEINLKLPENSFYVDNVYAFVPLPYIKSMFYLDVNLYRYHIGREEQSVNEKNMIRQIDQQIFVNKILVDNFTNVNVSCSELEDYLFHYLEIITGVSSIMLIKGGEKVHFEKKEDLWTYIRETNSELYLRLRKGIIGRFTYKDNLLYHAFGRFTYKLIQIFYGIN